MRIILFTILLASITIDSSAQFKTETIKLHRDTLDVSTKVGTVFSVSYDCFVNYDIEKHNKEKLTKFCNDEVRSSIRREIGKSLPETIDVDKIQAIILLSLDSTFTAYNIKLEQLIIKKL